MAAQAVGSTQSFFQRGWARLSRRKQRTTTTMTTTSGPIDEAHEAVAAPLFPSSFQRNNSRNVYRGDNNQIDPSSLPDRKNILNRGMDKLRRSFRKSFSRGARSSRLTTNQQNSMEIPIASTSGGSSKNSFQQDEAAVRGGTCQFQVKYLGSCEVFEPRGMAVCENALRHLRERKRSTKSILYVSGDSLRVVDQEHSRGLILDQTVEKVSFCAPDRRNDKGFAYICRDGATRRWMCHGFQAVKDSGERLSHAVGCSFAICLEKKKKREAEIEVFNAARTLADEVNLDRNGVSRNNQAYSSFRRQLSLSERKQDPQAAIVVDPVPIQRPSSMLEGGLVNFGDAQRPVNSIFDRQQSSFHAPSNADSSLFRRYHSLRTEIQDKIARGNLHTLYNEPIYEGEDETWPGCTDNGSILIPHEQVTANKENGSLLNGLVTDGHGFTLKPLNGSVGGGSAPVNSLERSTAKSADDWLANALQSMPSISSSNMNGHASDPPNQPPPPLPPSSIISNKSSAQTSFQELNCPTTTCHDVPEQSTHQSIKYQILEETDVPPCSPPRTASPLVTEVDLFGQPIFNPLHLKPEPATEEEEEPSAFVQLCAQKSSYQSDQIPMLNNKEQNPNKEPDDPFDIRWSNQILESARSTTTTTPRNKERAPVNV